MSARPAVRYRFICLAEWQICALLGAAVPPAQSNTVPSWRDGRFKSPDEIERLSFRPSEPMTQLRVPASLWRVPPKPGALIWVQEPFIHYEGKGRDKFVEEIAYRASAGPAGGLPPAPESVRNRQVRTHVCGATAMRRWASRLTLEVTRCWQREWSYWESGDREREGFRMLKEAFPAHSFNEAFALHWKRAYRGHTEERGSRRPILVFRFNAHAMNIADVLSARAKAVA